MEDCGDIMNDQKPYKILNVKDNSNLWIVSMIPGDRKVAGCFNFSICFLEVI